MGADGLVSLSHSHQHRRNAYFTEFTISKGVFYLVAIAFVCFSAIAATLEPLLTLPCEHTPSENDPKFENAAYQYDPCRNTRFAKLAGLTPDECMFCRRLVVAVVLGGIIGWERRQADRPAGIRTMSLVSLGSCLFSICSAFAFLSGPMTWDASRVSAAIPSGVGFLGAGLIFKQAEKDDDTGESTHVVHGLTTASSLWLSSAVGIACGGGLYFVAALTTALMLVLLRFGPRFQDGDDDLHDHAAEVKTQYASHATPDSTVDPEMQRIVQPPASPALHRKGSIRSRPSLL